MDSKYIKDSVAKSEDNISGQTIKARHYVRKYGFMLFLLALSVALEFARFKLPFLPSFLDVDFSIFPEFVSALFFGPIVGIGTVVLKNLLHMLIFYFANGNISYVGEISNLITDVAFILIAFSIFFLFVGKLPIVRETRKIRIRGILDSGTASAFATSIIMLPVMRWIIYPWFVKYFSARGYAVDFLKLYQEVLPSVENLWQGLFIFNLPWIFFKLIVVTLLATLTYALITNREK